MQANPYKEEVTTPLLALHSGVEEEQLGKFALTFLEEHTKVRTKDSVI